MEEIVMLHVGSFAMVTGFLLVYWLIDTVVDTIIGIIKIGS